MSESASKAVFLSYASQDALAATRITEALRSGGVEVWFDQSELVGGDTWDAKIRKQIQSCALFVPIISANTQERREGYFRLEWHLAEDRMRLIAKGTPFIVPVSVDETTERGAIVPEAFTAVQWTKLSAGETTAAFVTRVQKLLGGPVAPIPAVTRALPHSAAVAPVAKSRLPLAVTAALTAAVLAVVAYVVLRPAAAPPAMGKSIAVLPFENLSPDPDHAFFADGIHDEVITALAKIHDLTVISRTSVMAYRKSEGRSLKKIAAELGVGIVLEGSVQRAGNKVKVTAQLIDARTDQHRWAETYIEDLTDVFTIQAKLAGAITTALKATLSPAEKSLIARHPTENLAAYELYLRAKMSEENITTRSSRADFEPVVALFQQAVAADPSFALAYARLTLVHGRMYYISSLDPTPARRELTLAAMAATQRLAPDAPETHFARGVVAYYCDNDYGRALREFQQAELGLPNDAHLQSQLGYSHRRLGHWQLAVESQQRTLTLSPRDLFDATWLAQTLRDLRRYDQARALSVRCVELAPRDPFALEGLERAQFAVDGDLVAYLRAFAARPLAATDPTGQRAAYRRAMLAHDYAAAEQALADPRLKNLDDTLLVALEPVELHRALVAILTNQRELAQRYAESALANYRQQVGTPRQQPAVAFGIAFAKACAGRGEEAVREAEVAVDRMAKADAYGGSLGIFNLGRIYVMLNRRDEALTTLKRYITGPTVMTLNEVRVDPLWSRLKDDPRFEEILKSAKPL